MTEIDNILTPWRVQQPDLDIQKQFQLKLRLSSSSCPQIQKANKIQKMKLNQIRKIQQRKQKCLSSNHQIKKTNRRDMKRLINSGRFQKLHLFESEQLKQLRDKKDNYNQNKNKNKKENYNKKGHQSLKSYHIVNQVRFKSNYLTEKQHKSIKTQNQMRPYQKINLNQMRQKIKLQRIQHILMKKLQKSQIKIKQNEEVVLKRYSIKNLQWNQRKQSKFQIRKFKVKMTQVQENTKHVLDKLFSNY